MGNAWLLCVSSKHLTHKNSTIFGMSYKMVPSLESLLMCTPRLLPRPMTCFESKITRLTCNHVDVSFHHQGYGNHNSPPIDDTNGVLHRYIMR